MMKNVSQILALGAISGIAVFAFENCGVVHRPKAADQASFSVEEFHARADIAAMECKTCHENDRKTVDHYAGIDCKGCHVAGQAWWMGTTASHNPTPNQCAGCHGPGKPIDRFPPTHHKTFGSDCILCHYPTIQKAFVDYKGAVQKHSQALIDSHNCGQCHASGAAFPKFPATGHPPTNGMDCYSCHQSTINAGFTKWVVGVYQHTNAQLTTCATCHGATAPQKSFPVGHIAIGAKDCSECHQATVNSGFLTMTSDKLNWKGGVFNHDATIAAGKNCASCHAIGASSPAVPANHIPMKNLDCSTCHNASITGGFKTWAGGVFSHDATLIAGMNCASCHVKDRPATATANVNPSINDGRVTDKTHFNAKDCYTCHMAPPGPTNWRGTSPTTYEHTNASAAQLNFCMTCHINRSHVGRDGSVANDIVGDGKCQQCHQTKRSWNARSRNANL